MDRTRETAVLKAPVETEQTICYNSPCHTNGNGVLFVFSADVMFVNNRISYWVKHPPLVDLRPAVRVTTSAASEGCFAMKKQYVDLFWQKVNKSRGCWEWTGAKTEKGYGVAWDGKRTQKAHRVSYMLAYGKMPKLCVLHRCDNPACVNPDHLFLGTRADNNADMQRKGRHVPGATHVTPLDAKYPRGVKHHEAVLNPALVRKIRADKKNLSYSQLAKKYGIGMTTAYKVVKRITWTHVD